MKSAIIKTVGNYGGYQLARLLTSQQPKILMYHRFSAEKKGHEVTAATFEKQLQMIKRYFNPMTLAQLAAHMRTHGNTPKHAAVITVDDGYKDFYEVAYPLLKHYKIPATFYVTTGFVSGDLWLWPDTVTWLLDHKQPSAGEFVLGDFNVNLSQPNSTIWWPLVNHLLSIPNQERLDGLAKLATACGVALPAQIPAEYAAVDWSQLAEMQANGVEIGGHTVTHPSLGHMPIEEAEREIRQSLEHIVHHLGEAERTFCYPNGQPGDYSDPIKKIVSDSPYTAAVTAFSDRYNIAKPYAWRRFVGSEESFQFKKSLFGVEHLGNLLRATEKCTF